MPGLWIFRIRSVETGAGGVLSVGSLLRNRIGSSAVEVFAA